MAKHKITIESDNLDELVQKLFNEFRKQGLGPVAKPTVETVRETQCEVCGLDAFEKRGISKSGKPFHAIFCITERREHTKWLED